VTKDAKIFKEYLIELGMNLKFIDDSDDSTILEINQNLENGINCKILVSFSDGLISVFGVNFIGGINPVRKNDLLDLINILNEKYTYLKFVLLESGISINSFIIVNDNFNPTILMNVIKSNLEVIEEEYSNIMKVMWA